jgi:hypothetical protein
MRTIIKELLGSAVEFFDDKSGSLLDVHSKYRADWWNQAPIQIVKIGKKEFEVMDVETGEKATHRYNKVKEAKKGEITFISK